MAAVHLRRSYPRRSDIIRTVEAARASGLVISGLECCPDGTIRLLPPGANSSPAATQFDAWNEAEKL